MEGGCTNSQLAMPGRGAAQSCSAVLAGHDPRAPLRGRHRLVRRLVFGAVAV